MSLAQQIALDITRRTPPLHSRVLGRFLAGPIDQMLALGFEPRTALDPRCTSTIDWLQRMDRGLPGPMRHPAHAGLELLRRLLRRGEPYEAEVPLRRVLGVTASAGDTPMRLDSLPETMRLREGETYGPLSETEMARLQASVMHEFSPSTAAGVFHLDLQQWDGMYIAHNEGASRRFALWRRLSGMTYSPVWLQAKVTPYDLDGDALHALRDRFRLICCQERGLLGPFMEAEEIMPHTFAAIGSLPYVSNTGLFVVPTVHCMPAGLALRMRRLHQQIDEAGVFDLGRYLTEQISVARRRSSGQG